MVTPVDGRDGSAEIRIMGGTASRKWSLRRGREATLSHSNDDYINKFDFISRIIRIDSYIGVCIVPKQIPFALRNSWLFSFIPATCGRLPVVDEKGAQYKRAPIWNVEFRDAFGLCDLRHQAPKAPRSVFTMFNYRIVNNFFVHLGEGRFFSPRWAFGALSSAKTRFAPLRRLGWKSLF